MNFEEYKITDRSFKVVRKDGDKEVVIGYYNPLKKILITSRHDLAEYLIYFKKTHILFNVVSGRDNKFFLVLLQK
jgi:hypothetical protein